MVVPIHRGLRYVTDAEPGIRRTGTKRFRYTEAATGRVVDDPETLDRIRAVAVPPAWTDVWICADPNGHMQATGRDARGRKQYRYHPDFRAERERTKFDELVDFGSVLGGLRKVIDTDLRAPELSFERMVALVVSLLECTFMRVGNECYAATNKTYGLTTLRRQHVAIHGSTIRMTFAGKGGRKHMVAINDPRVSRMLRRCQDLPGQLLFRYEDDTGDLRPITSTDVNEYLRDRTQLDVTAKTFRTWGATLLAAAGLAAVPLPKTPRRQQAAIKVVVDTVAAELCNTPTVARASYIHPMILESFENGRLHGLWEAGPARPAGGLMAEERKLLDVLTPPRQHRKVS